MKNDSLKSLDEHTKKKRMMIKKTIVNIDENLKRFHL